MRYNTIFNNPIERTRVTYSRCWWDGAFSDDELNQIILDCEKEQLEEASILGGDDPEGIRKSKIKFFNKNQTTLLIFERLNFIIKELNDQFYGFDLNGYDAFQYTSYDLDGKYDWHMDICLDSDFLPRDMTEPRKLSATLQLNDDFEGGDFQLNLGKECNATTCEMKKGRVLVFPSYVLHRVTPVTKGCRKSIVVWVTGPKFR